MLGPCLMTSMVNCIQISQPASDVSPDLEGEAVWSRTAINVNPLRDRVWTFLPRGDRYGDQKVQRDSQMWLP